MSDVAVHVYNNFSKGGRIERQFLQALLSNMCVIHFMVSDLGHRQQAVTHIDMRHLAKDPRLEIQRRKEVTVSQQQLRAAQEEIAIFVECKVETREDATLRLRIKVHDGVAADQQIKL